MEPRGLRLARDTRTPDTDPVVQCVSIASAYIAQLVTVMMT